MDWKKTRRWLRKNRLPLMVAAGALALCLGIVLLILPLTRQRAVQAMKPADLEPADMMALMVAESEGVPLEAAGAAARVRSLPWTDAAEIFDPMGTDALGYLESAFSGRTLERAEAQAERLAGIAAIARNKTFPLAEDVNYDYSDSWGMGRSDHRQHEGIDIFADMGEPVRSVCDGVVEKRGWLKLGGWRIGIRGDDDGVYYYYAHLSAYADADVGDRVTKGQIIGFVGDTGYGPEGTTGQFVPHLHFGMYQGVEEEGTEKAFSPYPFLTLWDPYRSPDLGSLREE